MSSSLKKIKRNVNPVVIAQMSGKLSGSEAIVCLESLLTLKQRIPARKLQLNAAKGKNKYAVKNPGNKCS